MKLTPFTSAEEFTTYCAKSLKEAPKRRKSTFKYFSINTITSVDGVLYPQSRMVVLREVFENFDFHIYTDLRTEKVVSLESHKEAYALFYDPKKMIQIPKIYEVVQEANAKGITAYRIAKDTRLSTQTVYAYFKGERVSVRTQETIINYINRQ